MTRRWQLVNVTRSAGYVYKGERTIISQPAADIAIFKLAQPYRTKEQLLVWRSTKGWTAHLTGTEGVNVTDRLPQERWEEIYLQALAAFRMLGRVPDNLVREII